MRIIFLVNLTKICSLIIYYDVKTSLSCQKKNSIVWSIISLFIDYAEFGPIRDILAWIFLFMLWLFEVITYHSIFVRMLTNKTFNQWWPVNAYVWLREKSINQLKGQTLEPVLEISHYNLSNSILKLSESIKL